MITGKSAHLAGVVWQNSMRDCDSFLLLCQAVGANQCVAKFPKKKMPNPTSSPRLLNGPVGALKAAHVWGERPNLYIATFGKGHPSEKCRPSFGKVKIIGKSAHVASGWVFATRKSRVFEGLVEVFLWNKQCIWNKSFRDPEFLQNPKKFRNSYCYFLGGFGWVRWWKIITTCFPRVLLGFRNMFFRQSQQQQQMPQKIAMSPWKMTYFWEKRLGRMDAKRRLASSKVLGEFSGHEMRWRIHLLVEGSLGWKVGLKWRWN